MASVQVGQTLNVDLGGLLFLTRLAKNLGIIWFQGFWITVSAAARNKMRNVGFCKGFKVFAIDLFLPGLLYMALPTQAKGMLYI